MVVVMHRDNFGTGDGWDLFPPELYNPLGLQESCFPSGPVAMVHLLASQRNRSRNKYCASGRRAKAKKEMDLHQTFLHNPLSLATLLPSLIKKKKKKERSWSPSSSLADCSGCFPSVNKMHLYNHTVSLISELFWLKNNFPHIERFERHSFQPHQLPCLIHCVTPQTLTLAEQNQQAGMAGNAATLSEAAGNIYSKLNSKDDKGAELNIVG